MERMTPYTPDFNSLSKKQLVKLVIATYNDCFRLEEENKNLNEKVRFLEECLDRKEKLNEKYRKELKSTYVYDAKQVRDIC